MGSLVFVYLRIVSIEIPLALVERLIVFEGSIDPIETLLVAGSDEKLITNDEVAVVRSIALPAVANS